MMWPYLHQIFRTQFFKKKCKPPHIITFKTISTTIPILFAYSMNKSYLDVFTSLLKTVGGSPPSRVAFSIEWFVNVFHPFCSFLFSFFVNHSYFLHHISKWTPSGCDQRVKYKNSVCEMGFWKLWGYVGVMSGERGWVEEKQEVKVAECQQKYRSVRQGTTSEVCGEDQVCGVGVTMLKVHFIIFIIIVIAITTVINILVEY